MNNNNIGMMILYQPFSIYSLCMALLWTGIFIMSVHFLMKNSFFIKTFLDIYAIFATSYLYNANTSSV